MKLDVLHITNAYPYDETPEYGVFVKEQIESLDPANISNNVVFINGRRDGKRAYIDAIKDIRKFAKTCDVIHCHHAYSFFVATIAGVVGKKPIVLSFLNDWTYEVKGLRLGFVKEIACRVAVRLSSKVIFKSPVPTSLSTNPKVINLPNGVDGDFFIPKNRDEAKASINLEANKNYLLFVSSKNQYREQKRYDIFEQVVSTVNKKRPDLGVSELVMVGQPRHLIPTIFSAASVHVLTSDYEGSPNSVKESLCCGTPVVARDVGNVRDMLTDVPGGYVVCSSDPIKIADSVILAIDCQTDSEAIRAGFLAKGITKQLIAKRLQSIYFELAS